MTGKLDRRDIFRLAIATGATCVLGCGTDRSADDPEVTEVRVPLASVPPLGVIAVSGMGCGISEGVLIGRDDLGIYAYSNVCTHQGGIVPVPDATGISSCCLHGSKFDATGALVKGVVGSQGDLPHFVVRIEGDEVVVRVGDVELDRSFRVSPGS